MLKAWKFICPMEGIVGPDGLLHRGYVAVAIAENVERARARLEAWAIAEGLDASWLAAADVTEFDVDKQGVLCWAQV